MTDIQVLERTISKLHQERDLWRTLATATDRQLLTMIWEFKAKGSDEPVPAKRLEWVELIAKLHGRRHDD